MVSINQILTSRIEKKHITNVFLFICIPIHLWAIFLVFSDIEWIINRTVFWDAIGYTAYSLVFAFLESVVFLIVFILLALLLPKAWRGETNYTIISSLAFVTLGWGIANQLNFYLQVNHEFNIYVIRFYELVDTYKLLFFVILMFAIMISVIAPIILSAYTDKGKSFLLSTIERFSVLGWFLIFLDTASLLILIYRHLSKIILL